MTQANDGGRHALAGFLYQILGTAKLAAEILGTPSCDDDGVVVDFAVVEIEGHGQDATISTALPNALQARELVQFKYSGNPLPREIAPKELTEILNAFRKSERSLKQARGSSVRFRLVANRQLSEKSRQFVKAGNGTNRPILERFDFQCVDDTTFRHDIEKRAQAFGVLLDEIPRAVTRLVGAFFQRAASVGNRAITAMELDEELVGFPDPRKLTDCGPTILEDLGNEKTSLQLPLEMLPREELLRNPVFGSRALVIIHGNGGVGKTVAACQILETAFTSPSHSPPPFTAIGSACLVHEAWIPWLVSRWRNSPLDGHRREDPDVAIKRLVAATVDEPGIFLLALDDVDEIAPSPQYHAIGEILQFFHREDMRCQATNVEPRAVLLVTCRNPEEVYSKWIYRTDYPPNGDSGNRLLVKDFSDDDLSRIATVALKSAVSSRIRYTLRRSDRSSGSSDLVGPTPRAAHPEVVEALKHPGLWRFFSELLDESEQQEVLDFGDSSLSKLCRLYIDWLCRRTSRRKPDIAPAMSRAALHSVASRFSGDPGRIGTKNEDWIQPALAAAGCSRVQAEQMFLEASSLGLVEQRDARSWKWRHPFMCEHMLELDS